MSKVGKRKHTGTLTGIILLILLILSTIFLLYCTTMVFRDQYPDKYTLDKTDHTLTFDTVKAAVSGSEFQLSNEQINTFLNEKITVRSDSENGIEKIRIYLHNDDNSEVYAKLRYRNYSFAFYAQISITTAGSNMKINLSNARLGELAVPDFVVSYALGKIFENHPIIKTDDTAITLDLSIDYTISENNIIHLSLRHFESCEGYAKCRTNNLTLQALKALVKKFA